MTTMAGHVAARLVQDTQIVSYVADRVFAWDIRADGPDAHPETRGPFGFLVPHIVVDDQGGTRSPFGAQGTYQDAIGVWVFAEHSVTGRAAIEALTARILIRLHRWQEANTKAQLFFANRTGFIADPPPATGAQEQLRFTVAGTFAGVAT